ncbi:ArsR/SmtB family transcription factor [Candidatus Latescibacterota bacterium]
MARRASELISRNKRDKMVRLLKAVAHPVRIQIVNILLRNECRVGELVKTLGAKQSHTSQQLSIMKYSGLLKSRRNGNVVYYSLATDSIKKIVETIIDET